MGVVGHWHDASLGAAWLAVATIKMVRNEAQVAASGEESRGSTMSSGGASERVLRPGGGASSRRGRKVYEVAHQLARTEG